MGMASYINREAVVEEINDAISNIAFTSPYQNDIDTMVRGMERVLDIVEDAFACDVVEVVRCNDCKKWEYDKNFSGRCVEWRRRTLGNHFCSYGERKDNG